MTISDEIKLPLCIGDSSGLVRERSLLVFGGGSGEGFNDDIFAIDPGSRNVGSVGRIPYASRGHQIVDLGDGTALMIGGFDGQTRSDVHRIDLQDFTAREQAPCPVSIAWFAAAKLRNTVTIIGGFNIPQGYLSSVMTYDIAQDRWDTSSGAIPSNLYPRGAFGANVLVANDEQLISLGGADSFDHAGGRATTLGTVSAFQPENKGWTTGFGSIRPREGIAGARSGDDLFLIGGMADGAETASPLIEAFDLAAGKVRATGALALGRLTPVAGIIGDRLIVAGGVVRPLNEMTDTIEVIPLEDVR